MNRRDRDRMVLELTTTYHHLRVGIPLRRVVIDTTLC